MPNLNPGHNMGREPRGEPFPGRRPQGCKEQTRKYDKSKHETQRDNKKDPQKKQRLGTVSKKMTGGLKLVSRNHPHPYFWSWFAWKIPNLSMYHLLVHTIRDIKPDKTKIRINGTRFSSESPDLVNITTSSISRRMYSKTYRKRPLKRKPKNRFSNPIIA